MRAMPITSLLGRRRRRSRARASRRGRLPVRLGLLAALIAGGAGLWHAAGPGVTGPAAPVALETDVYRVSSVIDGDTLDLVPADNRRAPPIRVRLLNINTPERRQRGWTEARDCLERLVRGRDLRLRFAQPGQPPAGDRYDRVLAYVFVGNVNVNVEIVRQGWSPYWTRYGEGRFPDEFRRAEAEARAKRRGLWADL